MTAIPPHVLIDADLTIRRMSMEERIALADEVFKHQPNLLASALVQQRFGSTMQEIEVLLNVLLVAYQAMKTSGHRWPVISEDTQEQCLQRLTGKLRFTEGLSPELQQRAIDEQINEHTERYLLAFVWGTLRDHDLLGIRTDAQKHLVLAAFNLVECIASTASQAAEPAGR
jgi:hypothetical protein